LAVLLLSTAVACSVSLEGTGGSGGARDAGLGGSSNSGGSSSQTGGNADTGGSADTGGGSPSGGAGGGDIGGNADGGSGGTEQTGGAAGSGGQEEAPDAGPGGTSSEADGGELDAGEGADVTGPPPCARFPGSTALRPPSAKTHHCYWVHETPATFPAAQSVCTAEQGHLATINSPQVDDFLASLVTDWNDAEAVWIGLSDGKGLNDTSSGTYAWITGEPWTFSNWGTNPTQPDLHCDYCNGKQCCEHRGAIQQDGSFWDRREDAKYRYICEAIP
jgi:hypothetical protein